MGALATATCLARRRHQQRNRNPREEYLTMATNRMGHKPGGGSASRNVRNVSAPKVEPKPHARNPGRVAQYGALVGNHATHQGKSTPYKGDPDFTRAGYSPPQGPTDNVKAVGVGGGRTIYKAGGQHGLGPAKPMPEGRDILSEYGS